MSCTCTQVIKTDVWNKKWPSRRYCCSRKENTLIEHFGEIIAQGGLSHSFPVLLFVAFLVVVYCLLLWLLLVLAILLVLIMLPLLLLWVFMFLFLTFFLLLLVLFLIMDSCLYLMARVRKRIFQQFHWQIFTPGYIHWIGFYIATNYKSKSFPVLPSWLNPHNFNQLHCVLREFENTILCNFQLEPFVSSNKALASWKLMDQHFWQMSLFVPR